MEADWEAIGKALTAHAIRQAGKYLWRSKTPHDLAKGFSPEEVAQEAIRRVWDFERRWNPEKNPDLLEYLKSVVDSIIWALLYSDDHLKTRHFPTDDAGKELRDEVIAAAQENDPTGELPLTSSSPDPESKFIEFEEETAAEMLLDRLYDLTSEDPEIQKIIECKMDGLKPRAMAEELGIPIEDVRNRIRRLNRYRSRLYFGSRDKD